MPVLLAGYHASLDGGPEATTWLEPDSDEQHVTAGAAVSNDGG